MATIKSYSDLQQSKKLAEILPLESADYTHLGKDEDNVLTRPYLESCSSELKEWIGKNEMFPCWSLAALLNYLKSENKFPEIIELSDGRFKLTTYIWDGENCIQVSIGDTIVDACCEMIIKLYELKML